MILSSSFFFFWVFWGDSRSYHPVSVLIDSLPDSSYYFDCFVYTHTLARLSQSTHTLFDLAPGKEARITKPLFIQVDYGRLDLLSLSESPHRDSAPFFLSRMRTSYRIMRHNWCCCCHGMPCDGCWLRLDGMLSFE